MPRSEPDRIAQRQDLRQFLRRWWAHLPTDRHGRALWDTREHWLESLAPGGSIIEFRPRGKARGNAGFTTAIEGLHGHLKAHLLTEMPAALTRLAAVDPQGARMLRLRYQQGCRDADTARQLQVSQRAVYDLDVRALDQLAAWLWSDEGDPLAITEEER